MKLKKRAGGNSPFGYHFDEPGQMEPDPTEAPIRLLLCDLFLEHRRTRTVAQVLNERGHRTRGGSRFSDTTVKRLLAEPAPGIVPPEIFQRCVAILDERAEGNRPTKRAVYLFAGLATCTCGDKLAVPSSNPGKYVCPSCLAVKVPAAILEEAFLGELERVTGTLAAELPDIRDLHTHWPSFTFTEKRSIVEQLVHRVEVGDGTINFHIYDISPSGEDAAERQRAVAAKSSTAEHPPKPSPDADRGVKPPATKPRQPRPTHTLPDPNEETLTLRDAARLLRLSESRVRMMIADGRLAAFRTGAGVKARIRIWRKDLERAAADNFKPQNDPDEAAAAELEIKKLLSKKK